MSDSEICKYKGVYKHRGCWKARIWTGEGECYLGHYSEIIDGARAYDRACICLRGWETAKREGLNLNEGEYKAELDYLENEDFKHLVQLIRQDGLSVEH